MQGSNSRVTYFNGFIIKEITDDELDEPLDVAAAREVHIMVKAKTGYQYIPKFYSLEGVKIKMERVYGTVLNEYIQRFPTREVYLTIVNEVKSMIRSIINSNVYHGDVSYENIIISNDGKIWLVDFGLATELRSTDDKEEYYRDSLRIFMDTFQDYLSTIGLGYLHEGV